MPRKLIAAATVAALGLAASSAASQDSQDPARYVVMGAQGQATLYALGGYQGPGVTLTGPMADLATRYGGFGSIRVQRGVWQLCEQRNFAGRCAYASTDHPSAASLNLVRIASARPVRPADPGPPAGGGRGKGSGCAPAQEQSTAGVRARFYPRPVSAGCRIEAPGRGQAADLNLAAREADRFCRARGFAHADSFDVERQGPRWFLADVLCRPA